MEVTAILITFLLVLLFISWKNQMDERADAKAPVLSEHARLQSKDPPVHRRYSPVTYYLYFFIPERDIVEQCQVASSIYYYLEKGDWGTLTHQGGIFISFTKDDSGETICANTLRGTSLDP